MNMRNINRIRNWRLNISLTRHIPETDEDEYQMNTTVHPALAAERIKLF